MTLPRMIVGCDVGAGPDSTCIGVYVWDDTQGKSVLHTITKTRYEALKKMQELHNKLDIPYRFEDKARLKPRTAMELMRWCSCE